MSSNIDKRGYSVNEVCRLYGICRQTAYNAINRGELKTFKIGNRRIISPKALEAWERKLQKASGC